MHKYFIDKIGRKVDSYNIYLKYYDANKFYTFKTFENSPEWNTDIDV